MVMRGVRSRRSPGVVTVEMALVLPVLMGMLASVTEFGLLFKDMTVLAHAAREGCRVVSLGKPTAAVQEQINASLVSIDPGQVTTELSYRTWESVAWSGWTPLGDTGGENLKNDAPQGAQIKVSLSLSHHLMLSGAMPIGDAGQPDVRTLSASMVGVRE